MLYLRSVIFLSNNMINVRKQVGVLIENSQEKSDEGSDALCYHYNSVQLVESTYFSDFNYDLKLY